MDFIIYPEEAEVIIKWLQYYMAEHDLFNDADIIEHLDKKDEVDLYLRLKKYVQYNK
jgi:hypothetical protein